MLPGAAPGVNGRLTPRQELIQKVDKEPQELN